MQVADLRAQLQAREAEMAALIDDINTAAPGPDTPAAGFDSEDVAASSGPPPGTPRDDVHDMDVGKQPERMVSAAAGSREDAVGAAGAAGAEARERSGQEEKVGDEDEGGRGSVGKAVQWLLNKLPRPWGK